MRALKLAHLASQHHASDYNRLKFGPKGPRRGTPAPVVWPLMLTSRLRRAVRVHTHLDPVPRTCSGAARQTSAERAPHSLVAVSTCAPRADDDRPALCGARPPWPGPCRRARQSGAQPAPANVAHAPARVVARNVLPALPQHTSALRPSPGVAPEDFRDPSYQVRPPSWCCSCLTEC